MNIRRPNGLTGFLVVAAFLTVGILAPAASATVVTPAGKAISLAQTRQTPGFVLNNAYLPEAVQCKSVTAEATTPTSVVGQLYNTNQPGVGTFSTGQGSVFASFTAPPKFSECAVYSNNGKEWVKTEMAATVTTNETNGKWSLEAYAQTEPTFRMADIGIPKAGAKIEIPALGSCVLTVFPGETGSVAAGWTNGANSEAEPSKARVDGQVTFSRSVSTCPEGSPAQFEAEFSVKTNPTGATPVLIEP